MNNFFGKNSAFLIPYVLFLIAGSILFGLYSKAEIHLMLNSRHNAFGDFFFPYITYLGDGVTVIAAVMLLLLVRYRFALLLALSNLLSAGITQLLKHTLFADVVRPKEYFKNILDIHYVEGVENYLYNSFPSGHTTAAFTTCFCISLMTENRLLKFLMFVMALTIGFSRVYISQHFFNDIYAGSLIGVSATMVVYAFIRKSSRINSLSWIDSALTKRN